MCFIVPQHHFFAHDQNFNEVKGVSIDGTVRCEALFQGSAFFQKAIKMVSRCILSVIFAVRDSNFNPVPYNHVFLSSADENAAGRVEIDLLSIGEAG